MANESNESLNPYAAPQAAIEPIPTANARYALASEGKRFAGWLLDSLFLAVIMGFAVGIPMVLRPADSNYDSEIEDGLSISEMWALVGGLLVWFIVQGWLMGARSQTLGKVLLRMKILSVSHERVGAGKLIVMRLILPNMLGFFFCGPLFTIIDALLIFRKTSRCLHDNFAGTIVVDLARPIPGRRTGRVLQPQWSAHQPPRSSGTAGGPAPRPLPPQRVIRPKDPSH